MTTVPAFDGGPKLPVHGKEMRRFDLTTVLADRLPKLSANVGHLNIELPGISSRTELKRAVNKALGPAYKALKEYKRSTTSDYSKVLRVWDADAQRSLEDNVEIGRPFIPSAEDPISYNRFEPNDSELSETFTSYLADLEHVKDIMGEPFTTLAGYFPPDYRLLRDIVSTVISADERIARETSVKKAKGRY